MYTLSNDFKAYIRRPETRKLTAAPILEVVDLMCEKSTTNKDVEQACARHRERDAVHLKLESLDFLLGYAGYILEDGVITSGEAYDFAALKRVFSIQEGDFLQFRNFHVREVLKKEFIRIYSDRFVDDKEELLQVDLQGMFGLSYDQFEEIKQDEVIRALLNGANPADLDISKLPQGFRV